MVTEQRKELALLLSVLLVVTLASRLNCNNDSLSICGIPLGAKYDSVAETCEPAPYAQMSLGEFHYKGPRSPKTILYDENNLAKWIYGDSLELDGRPVVKVGESAIGANQKLISLGNLVDIGGRSSRFSFGSQEIEVSYSNGIVEGVRLRKLQS